MENSHFSFNAKNEISILQLKQLSLDSSTFVSRLEEQQLGKPYKWAQNLCGLNFITCRPSTNTTLNIDYELTQESVPDIIKKIRNRLQSRLILYRQVHALEQKNIDDLMIWSDPLASARVSCTLVQWLPITWSEYTERSTITGKFIDANVVNTNHLIYSAIIIRGSAKLECLINISPDFPNKYPLWVISLSWNGLHNSSNNSDIRVSVYLIIDFFYFKRQ